MKNKLVLFGSAAILMSALSGCASAAQDLWNLDVRGNKASKQPVTSRAAPLIVPPDYALEPEQATAIRSQDAGREQVLEAIFGGPAERSPAERALSASAGAAETGIRSSVGDPSTNTVNKGSVTRDIISAPEGDGASAQAVAG